MERNLTVQLHLLPKAVAPIYCSTSSEAILRGSNTTCIVFANPSMSVDEIRNPVALHAAVHHTLKLQRIWRENLSFTSGSITKAAFPMVDMMLQMQRLGLRAMTMYQPIASAFIESALMPQSSGSAVTRRRSTETHNSNEQQIIGVGEEVLNVGTRMVPGKTTRVRRIVEQTPVQQDVTLHSETVILERRRPLATNGSDVLTEVTVEMSDFNEVPVVSKAVHLVEEVLLRKEVTSRIETIRDTVKRDKLEIEQPSQLPVVLQPAQKQEEHKAADETQNMKQSGGQKR